MINIPPIKASAAPTTPLLTEVSKTWKVGQILSATSTQTSPAHSNVLLQMGQHLIQTKTPVDIQQGQQVNLQVKSLGDPQEKLLPLLKLLPLTSTDTQLISKIATGKLREFIAVQQHLSQLQKSAHQLLSLAQKQTTPALPESLTASIQKLQTSLQVKSQNLDASQLKQLISNSGVFLENKLANQINQVANMTPQQVLKPLYNDMKLQLLSLSQQLTQLTGQLPHKNYQPVLNLTPQQSQQLQNLVSQYADKPTLWVKPLTNSLAPSNLQQLVQYLQLPKSEQNISEQLKQLADTILQQLQQQPLTQRKLQSLTDLLQNRLAIMELSQQVDQSISKITSLQLQPLTREGDNMIMLFFNLVFKDSHEHFDIQFNIQQENEKDQSNEESWKATLVFHFKTLGEVQSKIHLLGDRVSTVFYTEVTTTAEKIKSLLPVLNEALNKAGLTVISLDVNNQLPNDIHIPVQPDHLLDENA